MSIQEFQAALERVASDMTPDIEVFLRKWASKSNRDEMAADLGELFGKILKGVFQI